jgi:hypothetical protein
VGNFCASNLSSNTSVWKTLSWNSPWLCSPYIRKPTALIHFERELSVIAQKVMTLIVAHCQKATKNTQGFYLIEKTQGVRVRSDGKRVTTSLRVVEAFEEIYNNEP